MKINKEIVLVGAALLSLAACQTETKQPTDAEIDVLVSEKVEAVKTQLQEDCDANLLAEANKNADSILVASSNKVVTRTVVAPSPKAKKKVVTKKETPTPKTNPKADRFNNKGGDKKTVTKEQTQKKADRFNNTTEKKTVTPEQTKKKGDRFKK